MIQAYHQANGYPWIVALGDRPVLEAYNVTSTAIKYAVDRQGIITFYRGYGVGSAADWEQLFEELIRR